MIGKGPACSITSMMSNRSIAPPSGSSVDGTRRRHVRSRNRWTLSAAAATAVLACSALSPPSTSTSTSNSVCVRAFAPAGCRSSRPVRRLSPAFRRRRNPSLGLAAPGGAAEAAEAAASAETSASPPKPKNEESAAGEKRGEGGNAAKKKKKKKKRGNENLSPAVAAENDGGGRHSEPCNVVFTHTNADFDSLAAAVALSLLWSESTYPSLPTHVVLPRGAHPSAQRFLAFHKHLLPLRGFKTILAEDVRAVGMVDAQSADRIGRGKAWLEGATSVHVFDHHEPRISSKDGGGEDRSGGNSDDGGKDDDAEGAAGDGSAEKKKSPLEIMASEGDGEWVVDKVGSTTTLLVERLRDAEIRPAPHEATLFVLGIRADTGGLAYEGTTVRDAAALLWCLENGASQKSVSEFGTNRVSEEQRSALNEALRRTETETVRGLRVSSAMVSDGEDGGGRGGQYVAGMAQVCEELLDLTDSDVFLLGAAHQSGGGNKRKKKSGGPPQRWLSVIGRASPGAVGVDLNSVMRSLGGGGHPKAAAAALRCASPDDAAATAEGDQDEPTDKVDDDSVTDLQGRLNLASSGKLSASEALSAALDAVVDQIPEQLVASSFMVPKSRLITLDADFTVEDARKVFDEHGLKSAPVVDSPKNDDGDDNDGDNETPRKRFRGSLKLNDLVKAARAGRNGDRIRGMVRSTVETVSPDASLAEVEELMMRGGAGRIPVVNDEDGTLEGIVTRTDVLRQRKLYDEEDFLDR